MKSVYTFLFSILFLITNFNLGAQKAVTGTLAKKFKAFEVADLNISKKDVVTQKRNGTIIYDLVISEDISFSLELIERNLISPDYKLYTSDGLQENRSLPLTTYGYVSGAKESKVSLTFNEGFIYGFIMIGEERFFIEPLNHLMNSLDYNNKYVFYNVEDIIDTEEHTCGAEIDKHRTDIVKKQSGTRDGECFEVEWAIASDWLMFQSHGSVGGVEDHNIGVANDVQTNYDDEFADELQFVITEQYVSNCSTCDPWTNSTNASTLLNDFRNWGPTGFFASHDIGSLWTDRDFDGSTIGIAYLGVVCTGSRYNCLQDWSNNANLKRVMVAHEIGHNFNASHDAAGSPTIMAPSVNNTNSWSSFSISSIESHYNSRWCLDDCGTSSPPEADFTFNIVEDCVVGVVEMTNNSIGADTYLWEFEGGTPATSDEENPVVTYNFAGTYDVTLTVYNAVGDDSYTIYDEVIISGPPSTEFIPIVDGSNVDFINTTTDAYAYEWDFGDGEFAFSFQPSHEYEEDGVYEVILTATNDCGNSMHSEFITIATPPQSGIDSDVESGCDPLTVNFESAASNNTTGWTWLFPGGEPAESNEENPVVIYENPGIYDVTLIVSNPQGTDELVLNEYVEVIASPVPSFTTDTNGNTVNFENTSSDATSYTWDFGDGTTSSTENPSHTYADEGDYTVVLTAISSCGEFTTEEVITISLLPSASFDLVGDSFGCADYEVSFNNTSSSSSTSFMWTFEGGIPSTSTDEDPIVTYTEAGTYDVELIAINALGQDTVEMIDFITVQEDPIPEFDYVADELSVEFSNTSSFGIAYEWNFGDGTMSMEENPTHIFLSQGEYEVILKVENECDTLTISETIAVFEPVSASFTSDVTEICIPEEVTYSVDSPNATAYEWTFEGGTPEMSTEENPVVNYDMPGTYSVTLIVSNPISEDEIMMEDFVSVGIEPTASFTYSGSGTVVEFNNQSLYGESYMWDFGDGNTSIEESPTHDYMNEGEYTAKLTVTNSCGSVEFSQEVNSNIAPVASFTSDETSGCVPMEISFTDNSQYSVEERTWIFQGGSPATSSESNPLVTYNEPGIYPVKLTVSNEAGSDELIIDDYIVISDVPEVDADVNIEGITVTLTNSSDNADSYMWDYMGDVLSNEDWIKEFSENGDYSVILSAENECGTDEKEIEFTVDAFPTIAISSSKYEICEGESIQYSSNSSNVETYEWTFDGGSPLSSNDSDPTITYEESGFYSVTLKAYNQYGSVEESLNDMIIVNDQPTASFDYMIEGNVVNFTNTSQDGDIFEWDFGDGGKSNEANPNYDYNKDGEYDVKLVVHNGLCSDTVTNTIMIGELGIEEDIAAALALYPNPATNIFYLDNLPNIPLQRVRLVDVLGRVNIIEWSINNGKAELNISEITGGSYFLLLGFGEYEVKKKVAILK